MICKLKLLDIFSIYLFIYLCFSGQKKNCDLTQISCCTKKGFEFFPFCLIWNNFMPYVIVTMCVIIRVLSAFFCKTLVVILFCSVWEPQCHNDHDLWSSTTTLYYFETDRGTTYTVVRAPGSLSLSPRSLGWTSSGPQEFWSQHLIGWILQNFRLCHIF